MRSWIVSICLVVVVVVVGGLSQSIQLARAEQPPASPVVSVDYSIVSKALAMEQVLNNTYVPERDLRDLAIRLKRAPLDAPRVANTQPLAVSIGAQMPFWIADQVAHRFFQCTATLRYVTPHAYMWVENGYTVSDEDLKRSAERFENKTYPTTRQYFGAEWDPGVDGDVHVSIFNGHVPGVGGYYSSADEFTPAVNRYSNAKELFYINLDNAKPGSDLYDSILAHEFQHMIHWNSDRNEQTWVNEGMSELSTEVNGFNTGVNIGAFVAQPGTQLTQWADDPSAAAPNYGAAHSFMHYLLSRFGDGLIRSLVVEKDHGLPGLDKVLQQQRRAASANQVFADWVVANYLGDASASSDGRYGYRLSPLSPPVTASFDTYQAENAGQLHQYGAQYFELKGSGDVQIDFQGAPIVKLTPNDAHSGQYQWWSNRGDDSDMTLTHAFDLTKVNSASLNFWTWYDVENCWDYAYVAASTDGGKTWDTLKGVHNSDTSKNGNNLGWAYTGNSGGGAAPIWVQEHVDLTPYAGKNILLRFEYVTDDAVNHAGFCVDDISIPELNFFDDAETAAAGWDAKGFVRSENLVPEHFVAQLIEFGPTVRVRQLSAAQTEAPAPAAAPALQQASAPAPSADVTQRLLAVQHKAYELQPNDCLWNLAQQFLGDGSAAGVLIAATNAEHAIDSTYAYINDPRALRTGAKIAIPADGSARDELMSLRGELQGSISAPAAAAPVASNVPNLSDEPNTAMAPGAVQRIVVRGLGSEIKRAVLVISAIAPVTTEGATYHLSIRPLAAPAQQ